MKRPKRQSSTGGRVEGKWPYTARDVTLYIPFYQAHTTIQRVWEAVRRLSPAPARIIIVDDGSPQPFQDPGDARLEIVRLPENRGLANARNVALDHTRTELIAALDADVMPAHDWLEKMLEACNSQRAHGVGGRLDEYYQHRPADCWRARHMAQHWGDTLTTTPRFLYGANTLFLTEVLKHAGGYDPELRTNNEDRTMSDLLVEKGYTLVYTPAARAYHLRKDTNRTILQGYWKWHHARGLKLGHFHHFSRLCRRIAEVNFGIGRYRVDLDINEKRFDLLRFDVAIPWVFSVLDVQLYNRLNPQQPFRFDPFAVIQKMPPALRRFLRSITPAMTSDLPRNPRYEQQFRELWQDHEWQKRVRELDQLT
ncbi:MAG: glycosyltransferase family 2 protein [Lentisphaerae bacterium]|nr:MAG: glycosyltransferase family 2 protein [Lentisphaerota bacterium]